MCVSSTTCIYIMYTLYIYNIIIYIYCLRGYTSKGVPGGPATDSTRPSKSPEGTAPKDRLSTLKRPLSPSTCRHAPAMLSCGKPFGFNDRQIVGVPLGGELPTNRKWVITPVF